MSITLSKNAMTLMAAAIKTTLDNTEMDILKAKAVKSLFGTAAFHFVGVDLSEDEIDKAIASSQKRQDNTKAVLSECMELIPEFSTLYGHLMAFHSLNRKFKEAKAWTVDEKNKMIELNDYYLAHKEWIVPTPDKEITVDYDEYVKMWEEKNAGK